MRARGIFSSQLGQSLAELALALPVVLLLILLGIDIGRVFQASVTINNAARVGARFAASDPAPWSAGTLGAYQQQINNEWAGIDCTTSPIPPPSYPNGRSIGQPATVTLSCTFNPIVVGIVGGSFPVVGQATMPITSATAGGFNIPPQPTPRLTVTPTHPAECGTHQPSMTGAPMFRSALPGTPVQYAITVRNNDPEGCPARTFGLSAAVQGNSSGWTAALAPLGPLTVVGGEAETRTLTVTSPGNAGAQSKFITLLLSGDAGTLDTMDVVYQVASCTTNPTISAQPTSRTGLPGSTLTYQVTVLNATPDGCPDRTFTMGSTVASPRTGWSSTVSPASLTLAAGAEGQATLSVTSPANAGPQSKQVSVSATAGGGASASTSVTYTVATCAAPLTMTATPTSRTGLAGSTVTYNIAISNNLPTDCAARTFTLGVSFQGTSNNWSANLSPSGSTTLASGQSGNWTLSVTSPSNANSQTKQITVSTSGTGGASASVTVAYVVSSCVASPVVTANPTSRTGLAGSALTYQITVQNPAPSGCAGRTFQMSASATTGWLTSFSPATLQLASGGSGSTTLTVTSPGSASAQTRNITVTATAINGGSGSTTVQYVVVTCTSAPTVAAEPDFNAGPPGSAQTYTIRVFNNDPGGCAPRTFTLSAAVATPNNGWTAALDNNSMTLAVNAFSQTTLTVTSPSTAGAQFKTITVTATGTGGGTGSTTVTYSVVIPATPTPTPEPTPSPEPTPDPPPTPEGRLSGVTWS